MENIDDYIDKDASAEERQAAEQVLDGLNTLRLQNKVQQVAALRRNRRRTAWRRIFGLLSLLLLMVVGVLYFWPKLDNSQDHCITYPLSRMLCRRVSPSVFFHHLFTPCISCVIFVPHRP